MKSRDGALDFAKIVATVIILLHHFQQLFEVSYVHVKFYGGEFYFGVMVEFFFILSGYFTFRWITDIVEHRIDFGSFIKKKCIRLLPLMALAGLVYELLIVVYRHVYYQMFMGDQDLNLSGLMLEMFGIQTGWISGSGTVINNPTWYISVLLLCYVVFYLVTWIADRFGTKPIYFYIFMMMLGLGIGNFNINVPFLNHASGRGFFNFFIGILLADCIRKYGITWKKTVISICIILLSALYIKYQIKNYGSYNDTNWLSAAFFPSIIIILENRCLRRLFDNRIISVISASTYDAFIWHLNLIIVLKCIIGLWPDVIDVSNVMTEIVFVIVTLLIGLGSYYWIERPITRYLEKRSQTPDKTISRI